MAELRMRIFSNREKQQTLEELEEQVNEFLQGAYEVERVLQSGGDHFTTITVCYWDRPSRRLQDDRSIADLERELTGTGAFLPGGPAGSVETLSHPHELAAQGVRSLGAEAGQLEHPGLDSTHDNLRRSELEGHFEYLSHDSAPGLTGSRGTDLGETIAQSLAEELSESPQQPAGNEPAASAAELAWQHACELHRLEDDMLTALERLNATRAQYMLSAPETMDFLLSEEMLIQMIEQVRAASEELGSTLQEYALSNGHEPWQNESSPELATFAAGPPMADSVGPDLPRVGQGTGWQLPERPAVERYLQQLRDELSRLQVQLDEASHRRDAFVARLKDAIDSGDTIRQNSISRSLARIQRVLAGLRKDQRRAKIQLRESGRQEYGGGERSS